ncbi:MAG: zinc-ribbon domain-containing protein [Clostridia bacterium]|nr:zinc-ribbon domain-containing protein [Clostridia bacterium]
MFCFKCGMKNEDGAKFCEGCGAPLEYKASEEENKEEIEVPAIAVTENEEDASVTQKLDTQEINRNINTDADTVNNYAPQLPKQKKKVSLPLIITSVIVAILVVGALVLFLVAKAQSDPSKIVVKYFQSIVDHDYSTAYECMDISENEFTTKDMYVKAMNLEAEEEELDISDFTVEEISDDDALVKSYLITYVERGSTEERTRVVELVKQDSKQWLFFDVYKVAEGSNMVTGCTINVPAGSVLYFDGIEVGDAYYEDMTDYMGPAVDSYVIDKMFDSMHHIVVEAPYGETKEYERYFASGESVDFLSVELKESVCGELKKTADEYIRKMISAGTNNPTDFADIEKYFAADGETGYAESVYDWLCDCAINDEGTGVTDITVTEMELAIDEYYTANDEVEVSLDFEFTFSGVEQDWFFDDVYEEYEITEPRSGEASVYFIYENGSWKINDCYLSMSLYY